MKLNMIGSGRGSDMKYTIEGFDQQKMCSLGMDGTDAIILRWFVDFWQSGKMARVERNGKTYLWVSYKSCLEDIPIIRINNRQALARRFKKMCDSGLLEAELKTDSGGTYTCFRLNEKTYCSLIEKVQGVDSKVDPGGLKSQPGVDSKVDPKDPSTNKDYSTKSNTDSSQASECVLIYKELKDWYAKKYPEHFTKKDWVRESPAIKKFAERAVELFPGCIQKAKDWISDIDGVFQDMCSGKIKHFLKGTPPIPSALMSKGVWPRVIEEYARIKGQC